MLAERRKNFFELNSPHGDIGTVSGMKLSPGS